MDIEQIKDLMSRLEASKIGKLVLKKGDFELTLEKESNHPSAVKIGSQALEKESSFQVESSSKGEWGSSVHRSTDLTGTYVKSPMVGTYYNSPAPDQPPFVKVGDQVTENTVVCIVEAMKVMNEVKAGMNGTVAEILIDNAQPVEFGTRLLRIS